MKQSYAKDQHETAKREKRPLICIGYNGKYMKKPQSEFLFWGPVSERSLKEIQDLAVKIMKRKGG